MKTLFLFILVLWSFFPNLTGYSIAEIPIHIIFLLFATGHAITYFSNALSAPGWKYFAYFSLSILLSLIISSLTISSLLRGIAFASAWGAMPFLGIWLSSKSVRDVVKRLIMITSVLLCCYVFIYRNTISMAYRGIGPYEYGLNSVATILSFSFSLNLMTAVDETKKVVERISSSLLVFTIFYVTIFLLTARTAVIAQLATLFLCFIYTIFYSTNRIKINFVWIISLIILTIFLAYQSFKSNMLPHYQSERLSTLFESNNEYDNISLSARSLLHEKGIEIFWEHPITGIGLGNFKQYNSMISRNFKDDGGLRELVADDKNPHSIYVGILAETGILGSISFAFLIGWLIKTSCQLIISSKTRQQFDIASVSWIPAYMIIGLTHDVGGFFLILLMSLACGSIYQAIWKPQINWYFGHAYPTHNRKSIILHNQQGIISEQREKL